MKKKNRFFMGNQKNAFWGFVIVMVGVLFLSALVDHRRSIERISYSAFLKRVERGDVAKVSISGQDVTGHFKNGTQFQTVVGQFTSDWSVLRAHGVEFSVENQAHQIHWWFLLPLLLLCGAMGGIVWFIIRQTRGSGGGQGGNVFMMGKSKARMYVPSAIKDTFASVAGAQEAKEELQDMVEFLKDPKKYERLGAKVTRGVLLVGEPGNGKTLLARAVAGEAHCTFLSISGSDFIEVFVGVGAARVRDLFAQARKHAPCIIFIDEIDAVGRHRGSGQGGGNDEREQTLNQLLTEMDGFQTGGGTVIVMAATNRADVLDKALLRPGRFDRRIEVPYPDLKSREQILTLHAQTVKMDPSVDLHKIARGTPGFSGADLANLINESALIASKTDRKTIIVDDLENARDKMMLGAERKSYMMTEEDRKITAYHEAGHALAILLRPTYTDPLHKVTIAPRGAALGVTHYIPEREKYSKTKEEFLASITLALGGRAAEELIFGQVTSGAYSDFKAATHEARSMVCRNGMSDLGCVVYGQQQGDFSYSQATAEKIDEQVHKIINSCYQDVCALLRENKAKLDSLAHALLEKETLYAAEIYELLAITPRVDHRFNA